MKTSLAFLLVRTAAWMLLVLSASIALPILCRPFYYLHIALLHLPDALPWSAEEMRAAYDEMLNFCLFGTPFGTGALRWSQSGMSHFADCARLFRLDFLVLGGSAAVLLFCALLRRRGLRPARPLGHGDGFWAGILLSAAVLIAAILAALDFDRAFVLFHHLFFPGKDNWLFDPSVDQIILILPEVFFRNCAILATACLFAACAGLILWDLRRSRH